MRACKDILFIYLIQKRSPKSKFGSSALTLPRTSPINDETELVSEQRPEVYCQWRHIISYQRLVPKECDLTIFVEEPKWNDEYDAYPPTIPCHSLDIISVRALAYVPIGGPPSNPLPSAFATYTSHDEGRKERRWRGRSRAPGEAN